MFKGMIMALALAAAPAFAGAYSDAVKVDGDTIHVTEAVAADIKGESLATILMQAASTPVFDEQNVQIGYRLTDIDGGSVYETCGLRDGDTVLEIEGMPLSDPRRTVEILRYAKGLPEFDVLLLRYGVKHLRHVKIGR